MAIADAKMGKGQDLPLSKWKKQKSAWKKDWES